MTQSAEILSNATSVTGLLTPQYRAGGTDLRCEPAASHGAFPKDKPGVSVQSNINLKSVHFAWRAGL